MFEAIRAFTTAPTGGDEDYLLCYLVFGVALVFEGLSGLRAYRQTRAEARQLNRSVPRHVRLSPDTSVKTVVSEDAVAVVGNVLGIAATAARQITGQSLWDGVAALVIMAMLILVALALAQDNRGWLIGEAIEPEESERSSSVFGTRPLSTMWSTSSPCDSARRPHRWRRASVSATTSRLPTSRRWRPMPKSLCGGCFRKSPGSSSI